MIKPVNSYILIKLINEEEITKNGLILGTLNENNVKRGKVIETSDNSIIKNNDIVLFNVNDCEAVNYKQEQYCLVQGSKIFAVINGEENE